METTQKTMTVEEILVDVRKMLGDIEVPASKIEQIGIPIAKAINGIQVCIDAIKRANAEKAQQEAKPEIELVPAEESEDNA